MMQPIELTTANLGAMILAKRKNLNLTQEELALASGTGIRFIKELEKGKPTCQIGKIILVLNALDIKLLVEKSD